MQRRLNVRRQFILSCIEEAVIAAFLVAVLLAYRPFWVPLVILGLALFFVIKIALFPWHQPVVGAESMIGAEAEVVEDLEPEGMVKFEGVLWVASARGGNIASGETVRIVSVSGSKLYVVKV
jgi:membrane-bound ClpP family serine protease